MSTSAIPTLCNICDEHCGIVVRDDGKTTRITGNRDHPISRGFTCFKGKHFGAVHRSPHRLTRPLLRTKGGLREIAFEEAVDVMAEHFLRFKQESGAESVAFYKGEGLKHFDAAQYMRHLANGFGSPNYISVGSLCHFSQTLGHSLTYGGKPNPDFQRIGVAVIWGSNPAVSSPRTFGGLRKALRQGTRLVVIDPSNTETSKHATVHLRVRPGSDGFLALAFIKHAVEVEGLKPVDDLNTGWEDLVKLVQGLSCDDLLSKTDIGREEFREIARTIFGNRPGWTKVGLGLEHRPGGVQTIRATACLQSLLDPLNRPCPMSAKLKALPGADGYPAMADPIGRFEFPLFTGGRHEGQGMLLTRAVLQGDPYPIRGLLCAGGNPMLTFPSVRGHGSALEKLDFLAVFDLFMTPTAQRADLVFPSSDHLNSLELFDYGRTGVPYLGMMRPAAREPQGWPTWKLCFELAGRLGLAHLFPWKDNWEGLAYRLSGTSVTLEDLKESAGSAVAYESTPPTSNRWHTSDGTIHYRSVKVDSIGEPGIPTPESVSLPQEADQRFPFWLSTGDRIFPYQHGRFREVPAYRDKSPEPVLEVHPNAAKRMGVSPGDRVVLSTSYGSIELPVHLSETVREDCLAMTHGWEEANANELTGLDHLDSLSGFPWLKALPARIDPKRE
ncbi:MAG: molybdopterin-dependent oxidoreductase [Pseudomonadota bacterium]